MQVEYTRQFSKDLDKITLSDIKNNVLQIIEEIKGVSDASQIKNLKKLRGYSHADRIRTGDYRVGVFIEGQVVQFGRVAHRKDIYKVFP